MSGRGMPARAGEQVDIELFPVRVAGHLSPYDPLPGHGVLEDVT